MICLPLIVAIGQLVLLYDNDTKCHFSGVIDNQFEREFLAAVSEGSCTFVINSSGGSEEVALRIAEVVQNRNISVEVDRYCMSACFYIAIAAAKTTVTETGLITLHNSLYALDRLIRQSSINVPLKQRHQYVVQKTLRLFESTGIDIAIMRQAMNALKPKCIYLDKDGYGQIVELTYEAWAPTATQLRKLGIEVSSLYPKTRNDANNLFKKYTNSPFEIEFGPANSDGLLSLCSGAHPAAQIRPN